ncbi:hypothetical protein SAMN05216223_10170 [Actinacidiphila yanglinensis]|uniref:Uncharacterized protein n=1 Tax=Actinacidiphila yanglinensis TaxID=310779 RepID=A0A1H5SBF0_9ACTN|nr:hypothetical protein [Actinacidiphila yanglinensis]SEF47993.1 hypothetical protein SAMN05216223_10170 [Actinacidiphila yanglinensis]
MSSTSRELRNRLWLLVALVLAATVALLVSYEGVHKGAVSLGSSSAAGVRDVDTAREALVSAQQNAVTDAASDRAGTSGFSTKIAVATLSLTRAASENVTGLTGQQHIHTLQGLITSYTDSVNYAGQVPEGSLEHAFHMAAADSILGTTDAKKAEASDSTVMGRLKALQQEQLKVVRRQETFGWLLRVAWSLTVLLVVLLLAALAETHWYLRDRFGSRWNRQLLASGVLLLGGSAVLGVFTWQTHTGLFHARRALDRRHGSSHTISHAGATVARRMADTGFRAAAAGWIVAGGVILMVLTVWALVPRMNEYRLKASR